MAISGRTLSSSRSASCRTGRTSAAARRATCQSSFNSKSSLAGWENIILQAAQTWAQQTNINFAVVPDDGAPSGSGADEQGNPGFGDIRIGGYNFGSSTLALTYQPPSANNFSIAGDMTFNTGQSFNVGSTYDLFTVAMHEFGHALGLNESSVSSAVEYATYTGKKTGLASDDIAGIRSIYSANGPRTADAYNTNGSSNGTLSTAASINSLINTSSLSALVPNLDITTAGQLEYFSFTAPSGTGSTLALDVQSSGLSLLAPKVTVYGSNGSTVLASANGAGQYGTTLTVNISGVTAGEQFYRGGARRGHDADGHGPLCLGPQLQRDHSTHRGVRRRGVARRALPSTPATAKPTVRPGSVTVLAVPSSPVSPPTTGSAAAMA